MPPANGLHDTCGIGEILKEANRGDAGSPCGKTGGGVCEGNSADGEDWDLQRPADFRKAFEALRRAIGCF